ncbi:MAG: AAA family ATPase [Patescibacteria group bacterium]|nr:AAA family ATPase [Patescibacteria group bacterium]
MSKDNKDLHQEILFPEIEELAHLVEETTLPPKLEDKLQRMVESLRRMARFRTYTSEYESISRYIELATKIPWDVRTEDNLDIKRARKILNANHYGMEKVKERVLEYIAVLNLTQEKRGRKMERATGPLASTKASVLCFVGLPGIGKTSVAYSIAEALDRKFVRVAMGGVASSVHLRGRSRAYPQSEAGQVVKGLVRCGSKNPVILMDEIDRISEEARTEVMGVLLELLDPEQNAAFQDHYLDYPLDLSEVLFICTANHKRGIANAVLDRLEVIEMPAYTDEEKKVIGRDYLLPRVLDECGLDSSQVEIEEELWSSIIRPLGYDAGIRTLERTIQGICRKAAKEIVEEGVSKVKITEDNIDQYLPK